MIKAWKKQQRFSTKWSKVNTLADRDAIADAVSGDKCTVLSNGAVYQYDGTNWGVFTPPNADSVNTFRKDTVTTDNPVYKIDSNDYSYYVIDFSGAGTFDVDVGTNATDFIDGSIGRLKINNIGTGTAINLIVAGGVVYKIKQGGSYTITFKRSKGEWHVTDFSSENVTEDILNTYQNTTNIDSLTNVDLIEIKNDTSPNIKATFDGGITDTEIKSSLSGCVGCETFVYVNNTGNTDNLDVSFSNIVNGEGKSKKYETVPAGENRFFVITQIEGGKAVCEVKDAPDQGNNIRFVNTSGDVSNTAVNLKENDMIFSKEFGAFYKVDAGGNGIKQTNGFFGFAPYVRSINNSNNIRINENSSSNLHNHITDRTSITVTADNIQGGQGTYIMLHMNNTDNANDTTVTFVDVIDTLGNAKSDEVIKAGENKYWFFTITADLKLMVNTGSTGGSSTETVTVTVKDGANTVNIDGAAEKQVYKGIGYVESIVDVPVNKMIDTVTVTGGDGTVIIKNRYEGAIAFSINDTAGADVEINVTFVDSDKLTLYKGTQISTVERDDIGNGKSVLNDFDPIIKKVGTKLSFSAACPIRHNDSSGWGGAYMYALYRYKQADGTWSDWIQFINSGYTTVMNLDTKSIGRWVSGTIILDDTNIVNATEVQFRLSGRTYTGKAGFNVTSGANSFGNDIAGEHGGRMHITVEEIDDALVVNPGTSLLKTVTITAKESGSAVNINGKSASVLFNDNQSVIFEVALANNEEIDTITGTTNCSAAIFDSKLHLIKVNTDTSADTCEVQFTKKSAGGLTTPVHLLSGAYAATSDTNVMFTIPAGFKTLHLEIGDRRSTVFRRFARIMSKTEIDNRYKGKGWTTIGKNIVDMANGDFIVYDFKINIDNDYNVMIKDNHANSNCKYGGVYTAIAM